MKITEKKIQKKALFVSAFSLAILNVGIGINPVTGNNSLDKISLSSKSISSEEVNDPRFTVIGKNCTAMVDGEEVVVGRGNTCESGGQSNCKVNDC